MLRHRHGRAVEAEGDTSRLGRHTLLAPQRRLNPPHGSLDLLPQFDRDAFDGAARGRLARSTRQIIVQRARRAIGIPAGDRVRERRRCVLDQSCRDLERRVGRAVAYADLPIRPTPHFERPTERVHADRSWLMPTDLLAIKLQLCRIRVCELLQLLLQYPPDRLVGEGQCLRLDSGESRGSTHPSSHRAPQRGGQLGQPGINCRDVVSPLHLWHHLHCGKLLRPFARPIGLVLKWSFPFSTDRKSTRLNSSHSSISYAVFCLKKK